MNLCLQKRRDCVLNQLFSFLFLLLPKGTDKTSHKARNAIVWNLSTIGLLSADNLITRLRARVTLTPVQVWTLAPAPSASGDQARVRRTEHQLIGNWQTGKQGKRHPLQHDNIINLYLYMAQMMARKTSSTTS